MKSKSYATVLTIILLSTILIPLSTVLFPEVAATPTVQDLYEPDNVHENATVMSNDQLQQHNIYPAGDVDWLELRIDGANGVSTKVVVETFGSSGDTDISLYSLDLTMTLAHNDDKASGDYFSKITIDLTPGIYYVKVEGKGSVFDYSVIASFGRMFQITYGSSYDDYGQSVQQTSDGGYIVAGYAKSSTGLFTVYLAKTDSAGTLQWQNTYGSSGNYYGYSVVQTSDSGYIVAGVFQANNLLMTYLVKTDSGGNMQWEKRIGPSPSYSRSVVQTPDGGYIIAGYSWSDVCLLKIDSAGNVQWQKTYGGSSDDEGFSVQITSDGGYIVAGYSKSSSGVSSAYLVKTDSAGNVQWQRTYGGSGYYYGSSVQQTSDGGYIVAGTWTINNLIAPYVLKTDSAGNMQWQKTYRGYGDVGNSVVQTSDGGYIVAGSGWFSGSVKDVYLLKIDSAGNVQWQRTYGGSSDDEGYSVKITSDGGYILAGYSKSFSTDGTCDVYLLKTDQSGYSPLNRDVVIDEGTSLIPQVVYTILSDPVGDGSYNELVQEETTSWDFTLSAQATVSVGFEAKASFLGSGVSSSQDFSVSVGGSGSKSVEVTTTQHWSSNTISNDGHYIGPGYGDTYVGDAWLLHWRIVDRTFPNGTHANIVEYGPSTQTGFMLSAYQIKNGAVPEPYKSQMLALNPADDNYISNDEAETLSFVKTETISGGIPYDEAYSRTETSARTFTFNARMSLSTAAQLGFSFGPVDASGKVTVEFSFDMGISYASSTTTQTRTGFHIYDDDGADRFQVTVWYNPVFGTFVFNASGRNTGLPGTSNPRELWDNQAPTASNVRIVPSSPKTTDILTLLYDYSDPDGDLESGTQIWWFKGILHQAPYDNQHQIPAGVARKGEDWAVAVHPCDGTVYGTWQISPFVEIANSLPDTPRTPTGYTPGYVYTTYYYTTNATDPDGDNVRYYFLWWPNDGQNVTSYVASGTNASASHVWKKPGTYRIYTRSEDSSGANSTSWSTPLVLTMTQNDDGIGTDAGNSFTAATVYNPSYSKGTLYSPSPTDPEDWYQFYAENGQTISTWLSSTEGCNFDLELYYPNGTRRAFSNYTSSYDSIYITATVSGFWRMRIYRVSSEGLYYFGVSVYTPGPPGGCPILYTYSGGGYQCEGLLDIHDTAGSDMIAERTLAAAPARVHGTYQFQLIEHPQTISSIDQVNLFAVLQDGKVIKLPLIYARHSEYSNCMPQLLFDDELKITTLGANHNNGVCQSITLRFRALPTTIKVHSFIFQIEGNNMILKV